jgi:geranylgeranyl diphosphate synthase type II
MMMDFKVELNSRLELVENRLHELLEPRMPEIIYEAMGYSVFAGGKRLRPILVMAACSACGGDESEALDFACALEMIHTYSLIHDDLPALDNDDYRRGKLTNHKQFGDGIALLAGDGLLTLAFETMLKAAVERGEQRFTRAAETIARLSGSQGMLVGQVVDVVSEGKQIDSSMLDYIHNNKTGGLIKAALIAGGYIGGADEATLSLLEVIGADMGLAFQIKDDILDVTSTTEVLGKPVFSDEKNHKVTYVSMYGMDKAQSDYELLSKRAVDNIICLGDRASFLAEYAKRLINRIK